LFSDLRRADRENVARQQHGSLPRRQRLHGRKLREPDAVALNRPHMRIWLITAHIAVGQEHPRDSEVRHERRLRIGAGYIEARRPHE